MSAPVQPPALEPLFEALSSVEPEPRADILRAFARELHVRTPPSYFAQYPPEQLAAGIRDMVGFLEASPRRGIRVRVLRPDWLVTLSGRGRTAVEVCGPDQPFLVDTLRELLRVHDHPPLQLLHPILAVARDDAGQIVSIGPPGETGDLVSFMHVEIETLDDAAARALEEEAAEAFDEARLVARDFQAMTAQAQRTTEELRERAQATADEERREELTEAADFVEWLLASNFVFLGARRYRVGPGPKGLEVGVVPGSGLGILRDEDRSSMKPPRPVAELPADLQRRVLDPTLLGVHKSNSETRVLRRTRMDYLGIKEVDEDGNVTGEQRFLGLFTARALGEIPARIPVLRKKLARILEDSRVVIGSHDHKEIFSTFCSLPKPQLFLYDVEALRRLIFEIIDSRDRQHVRVLYQHDVHERSVSVLVLLPREHFNAEVRRRIQKLLVDAFRGTSVEYNLALSDEPLARLHFYLATEPGKTPHPPISELETAVARITRTWAERLAEELHARYPPAKGTFLADRFAEAFPAPYRARETPETAALDVALLEESLRTSLPAARVAHAAGDEDGASSIRIARPAQEFRLSRLMPTLTHLGLDVLDESTHRVQPRDAGAVFLHVFRAYGPKARTLVESEATSRLEEVILAAVEGHTADDALNALVPLTGRSWRDVEALRTYVAYLQQLVRSVRQRTAHQALVQHPHAAQALLELFRARFDPGLGPEARPGAQDAARHRLWEALDDVTDIQEDRILRDIEDLMLATVRTNFFQRNGEAHRPALAIKVRCEHVRRMPLPRPLYEIFVASPVMEGVHLRSGLVARGGIRWSARTDDFRTEVLGLMRAQRTKNALIVPVGAKGGFVLKRAPEDGDAHAEVRHQYETFVSSLLDLTDNVLREASGVDNHWVIRPENTVVHDEDDPYLVVAADRGTAQFSDLANSIAQRRGFWLGDAFASGGSTGYNHKEKGITARGAWECVCRAFRTLGRDIQTEPFTVAGIGDMSGDVFGNGMLLSREIRLVAAFDHRHVFIDPDPDAEATFLERQRLFGLERSTWDDFDRSVLSSGGGVYSRHAKSVVLSPEARCLLGVEAEQLNGHELVRAVLRLPVDLLWNGGIGTYVKASTETAFDVGDAANDEVRVDARELRARVVGEGGNLGFTPAARVEFARAGGLINADFIDNSGGVDLSDREVNLKILLDAAVLRGTIDPESRNAFIREVAGEVCEQVVRDNRKQSDAISLERLRHPPRLAQLRWLLGELEAAGLLHRELEAIPTDSGIDKLVQSGMTLVRPQLAAILAYAKIDGFALSSKERVADLPELGLWLRKYFPAAAVERFSEEIARHPLRREITVTCAVNDCVNRMGVTFLHRVALQERRRTDEVLHAWVIASRIAASDSIAARADLLWTEGQASPDDLLTALAAHADDVEEIVRWCLRRGLADGLRRGLAESRRFLDEARAIQPAAEGVTPPVEALPVGLDAELRAALERGRHLVEELEALHLSRTVETSRTAARRALELAGERLLVGAIEAETRRIVRTAVSDWEMCGALVGELRDLRLELARRVLSGAGDGGEDTEGLARRARELVPDGGSLRRRVVETLGRSGGRQPVAPSGLWVLVETLRRIVE